MQILNLYKKLRVVPNQPASERNILLTQNRLGGTFPSELQQWFREADGFSESSDIGGWCFYRLEALQTVEDFLKSSSYVNIRLYENSPSQYRTGSARDYLIFCSQNFVLPYYAVNIRSESPHFGEVIAASENTPTNTYLTAPTFERFSALLFENYDTLWMGETIEQ